MYRVWASGELHESKTKKVLELKVLCPFRYLCRWGRRDSSVRGRSINLCPPSLRRSTAMTLCIIIRHYCGTLKKRCYTFKHGSLALAHVSRGTVNMLRFLSLNPTTRCCSVLQGLLFFASVSEKMFHAQCHSVSPFEQEAYSLSF